MGGISRDSRSSAARRWGASVRRSRRAMQLPGWAPLIATLAFPALLAGLASYLGSARGRALPFARMNSDFFNIESALTEEERAVRDSVRRFVDERVLPIIGDCYVEGRFPRELIPEMAALGVLGANLPETLRLRWAEQRGVRAHHAGARTRRFRHSFVCVGAGRAGDVSDLCVRERGAQGRVAPAHGPRRGDRLLRAHRVRLRLEPVGDDHDGRRAARRHLAAQRRQDVDHQRLAGARRRGVGEDQRRTRTRRRSAASSCRPTAPASRRRK